MYDMYEPYQQEHGFSEFIGNYIGLDPSLTSFGVSILNEDYLTSWVWKPHKDCRGAERLSWFFDHLVELMRDFSTTQAIVFEGYAFSRPNQAHQIGELGGLVRLASYLSCRPMYEVQPNTLKKFVTGSGVGGKSPIALNLYKRWGFDVEQEDMADATGLAVLGLFLTHASLARTKAQADAIKGVRVLGPGGTRVRERVATGCKFHLPNNRR